MVPNGWKEGIIEDIAKVSSGGTPSRNEKSYWDGGSIPWIRTTEVQNCVLNYEDTQEFITRKGLEGSSTKLVPSGTLLMAMIGQGKTRGQVALLNFEATTNQNCATILLKKNNSSEFYFNYLLSKYERIRNWSNSAGQSNLSGALVKSIPVMIPPLPEQQKIAKILSTWDKAISTTERLIENSTQQKKALMQQLLTGKKRLLDESGKPFEGEWVKAKVRDLVKSLDAGVSVNSEDDSNLNSEYKILKTSSVSNEIFDPTKVKSVTEETEIARLKEPVIADSIIISRMNTPILVGANGYVEHDIFNTFLPDRLWQIKPHKDAVIMKWLGYWFSSNPIRHLLRSTATGTSGSMKNITKSDVLNISITYPSVEEQQKIATVLTNADKEIELLEQQLADLQQEKKALMQVLLSGKKRVVVGGE